MNPTLIRMAISAMMNRKNGDGGPGKIIGALVGVIAGILILIAALVYLPFQQGSGMKTTAEDVEAAYKEYNSSVRDVKLKELGADYIENNTTKTESEDGTTTETKPKVIIVRKTKNPAFLLSYLKTLNENFEKKKLRTKKLTKFLDEVTYYKEELRGDAYYIEAGILDLEEILEVLGSDAKREKYKLFYQAYEEYYDTEDEVTEQDYDEFLSSIRPKLSSGSVPHYLQYDSRWAELPIMGDNIKNSGCSITSIAMVASYFNQEEILPSDVQAWAYAGGNPYYAPPWGASWSIFPDAATQYGLTITNLGTDIQAVLDRLGQGELVIASCNPGTFTSFGHFIVLTGIAENGEITVNDPNDNETKKFSEKTFPASLFARECAGYWAFWKEGFVLSSASDEEVDLIARIVALEAGFTDRNAMIAVAEVIKNRVESSSFPNTYTEVVAAPGQFTTYAMRDTVTATQEQLEIVSQVMSGQLSIFDDPDVLYFCSQSYYNSLGPYDWWKTMTVVGTYGNVFFKP